MDTLVERFFDAIHVSKPSRHAELGKLLRDSLLTFYRDEMTVFPDSIRVGVELLIAARVPAEDRI